jgi:hypothetical protein
MVREETNGFVHPYGKFNNDRNPIANIENTHRTADQTVTASNLVIFI